MQAVVEAQQVSKSFRQGKVTVHALKKVHFSARKGEFVAIMGPSGSGKSTLLTMLGGLDTPDVGDVLVNGRSLQGMKEAELAVLRRRQIGFVFQSFNLLPILTAAENVALPLLLDGRKGVQALAHERLMQVGLADRANHRPGELSGGQQQRVAIARALVTDPAILLADEPTGNLDSQSSADVMRTLRHTSDSLRQTVIVITHDPGIAAWADRVVFMRDGRLVGELPLRRDPTGASAPAAERTSAILKVYEDLNRAGGN